VYDSDELTSPDHEPLEFSFQSQGRGLDDPVSWLAWHVYEALQAQTNPPRESVRRAGPIGGAHSLSGLGDSA